MKRALVAGCGFVGKIVARLLAENGGEVIGLTRTAESADALSAEPFRVIACDLTDADALAALGAADVVIHCASSGRGGADAYRAVYLEGARNLLAVIQPSRFVFASSTSVYPQTDGSDVAEISAANPDRETGKILRETEELVLAHGGIVARLAGIYGPGRSMLLAKFLEGRAVIEGDGTRWLNQIHRDDAASALVFLAELEKAPGICNVCDDEPLPQRECYAWLARHFEKPLPPSGPIDLDRKRGWTNKRVSNAKLRALGWNPRYRSFREALHTLSS